MAALACAFLLSGALSAYAGGTTSRGPRVARPGKGPRIKGPRISPRRLLRLSYAVWGVMAQGGAAFAPATVKPARVAVPGSIGAPKTARVSAPAEPAEALKLGGPSRVEAQNLRRVLRAIVHNSPLTLSHGVQPRRRQAMLNAAAALGYEPVATACPARGNTQCYRLEPRAVPSGDVSHTVADARLALAYLDGQPDPAGALGREMTFLRGVWKENFLRLRHNVTTVPLTPADMSAGAAATRRVLAASTGLAVHDLPGGMIRIGTPAPGLEPRPPLRHVVVKGEARKQTRDYLEKGRIDLGTRLADGFAVPAARGRSNIKASGKMTCVGEIAVVDRHRDRGLRRHLEYARSLRPLPERERARKLFDRVRDLLAPRGIGRTGVNLMVQRWTSLFNNREIRLGDVISTRVGVCRHMALLFKVLGDEAGLDVALVAGSLQLPDGSGRHAWNEIRFSDKRDRFIVDVRHPSSGGFPSAAVPSRHEGIYYRDDGEPMYPAPRPRGRARELAAVGSLRP